MRTALTFIAALTLAVAVRAADDPITSFETTDSLDMFQAGQVTMERVREHASDGEWSLKVEITGSDKDTWPGIAFIPPDPDMTNHPALAFDVYNPDGDPAGLSYRVDDAAGHKRFEGARLLPQRHTTVEIPIKPLGNEMDLTRIVKFYIYSRMPRRNYTWYFDNFRYTDGSYQFKPRRYLETNPEPAPAPEDRTRGFMLFHRHWMDLVFPNSVPTAQERDFTLTVFATPGEHEPVTVSLRALRDLAGARASVSELRSGDGAVIAADAVTVYPVRCLNKREHYQSKFYIEDMPVLLERRDSVDVAGGTSQRFWLDIHVPDDAAPGSYRGTVTISAGGGDANVPLALEVLPFTLDRTRGAWWGEYYSGPRVPLEDPSYHEVMRAQLADMREHGMTSVGLCFGPSMEAFTITDDGVEVHYDENDRYVWFMDAYAELGFPAPVIQLSDTPQALLGSEYPLDSEQFAAHYKAAWKAMREEARRRGWPEVIVQPVDEPGWREQDARDRTVRLLKLIKEIPDMRTEQDGPADEFFEEIAGPFADVWNYNGGVGRPERVAQAITDGHIICCYNNDVECYRPELQRYAACFYLLASGTHGIYNWAYQGWRGSPYDDQDAKYGDFLHVYPATDTEVGGPATGWEGFREGTDDYLYCDLLRRLIARAREAGQVAQADAAHAVLDGIVASIDYKPRIRNTAKFERMTTDADGVSRISGRLLVPNGWDFDRYDQARRQVAE
ncbi:MAG: DUF4091 domain-containing protein, partial [Armatimonadetes bacterium]|nr:DUF4091 domain-containing protein [Armatimonadota bacterium]